MSSKARMHGELDFISTRWDVILMGFVRVVLVVVDSELEDVDVESPRHYPTTTFPSQLRPSFLFDAVIVSELDNVEVKLSCRHPTTTFPSQLVVVRVEEDVRLRAVLDARDSELGDVDVGEGLKQSSSSCSASDSARCWLWTTMAMVNTVGVLCQWFWDDDDNAGLQVTTSAPDVESSLSTPPASPLFLLESESRSSPEAMVGPWLVISWLAQHVVKGGGIVEEGTGRYARAPPATQMSSAMEGGEVEQSLVSRGIGTLHIVHNGKIGDACGGIGATRSVVLD
ncbi:hypothetical protein D9611_012243 [Ephemerocybe angulata]|uniref:Uncharacterized protein n=1 Tax=Ephemerocybe angulata TaxID=980116 RepID=A0A8H5ES65_9AGAR|nr:hypothetical protein D9611_012243 [Tulosesus angulatus]